MTSSPHLEAYKFEGRPIIFESSLSNSIIVDDSSRDDEIDMMNMDRPRDSTTTHDSSEAHSEGRLRSTSIDDEIYRPSNEYVLNVAFFSFVGFMGFQAIFAIIANSESMLADSEAMSVDAVTYLLNLVAEKIKSRPYTSEELRMPRWQRLRARKLKRLYLELIPPLMSVSTLMVVTVFTLKTSLATLFHSVDEVEEDVDVNIMLLFSSLNLVLDLVNVSCFAKAHQAFGLNTIITSEKCHHTEKATEKTPLLAKLSRGGMELEIEASPTVQADDDEDKDGVGMNLNMCSAWTHICADTLRSMAVVIAAGIATVFAEVDGDAADAIAALVVSVIILASVLPLIHGLFLTVREIHDVQLKMPITSEVRTAV